MSATPALRLVSDYAPPPRVPDELLADATIPDWAKMVWLAVRSMQSGNDRVWHFYTDYAAASGKSEAMVQKAVGLLKRAGWLAELEPASRGRAPVLRCLWKGRNEGRNPVPTKEKRSEPCSTKGRNPVPERSEQGSKPPTPPYKEESVKESVKEAAKARATGKARTAKGGKARAAPIPEGIDPAVWAEWEQHRREIGKSLKPTTVKHQLRQLTKFNENGHDPNEIIRTSIANGWTGLFEPDPKRNGQSARQRAYDAKQDPAAAYERISQAVDDALGL